MGEKTVIEFVEIAKVVVWLKHFSSAEMREKNVRERGHTANPSERPKVDDPQVTLSLIANPYLKRR